MEDLSYTNSFLRKTLPGFSIRFASPEAVKTVWNDSAPVTRDEEVKLPPHEQPDMIVAGNEPSLSLPKPLNNQEKHELLAVFLHLAHVDYSI
ncbi:unnamed protein product [Diatraea saccharalis]|uniref:Uncharacterized protein n=1 Tax=Diatraea saccharalis TaxID=40085 RepID=A0A9N9QWA2_9NEOP|nr:unnamed protein product [Diatraea saccharalis]